MKDQLKFGHDTVQHLLRVAKQNGPQQFKAFLMGGIIANVVGNLPEAYWKQFIKVEPCEQPNCNCHELAAEAVAFLATLRNDYQKHGPRNN